MMNVRKNEILKTIQNPQSAHIFVNHSNYVQVLPKCPPSNDMNFNETITVRSNLTNLAK